MKILNLYKLCFILSLIVFFCSNSLYSQTNRDAVGQGFSKQNRKSIDIKMNKLIQRVSEENNCPLDSISYVVIDKYTTFYSKSNRHLPKKIMFKVFNKQVTYKHEGLSGAILYWLLGSWVLI